MEIRNWLDFFPILRNKMPRLVHSMIPCIGMRAPNVQQYLHVEEASQGHFYEQTNGPLKLVYFPHANKQENNVS